MQAQRKIFKRNRVRRGNPFGLKKVNVVSIIKQSVQYTGLWQEPYNKEAIWSYIAIFVYIATTVTQTVTLCSPNISLEDRFEILSVFTFSAMGIFKLHSLQKCKTKWKAILSQMQAIEDENILSNRPENIEYESEDENDTPYDTKVYTKRYVSIAQFLRRFYLSTLIVFMVGPVIEYLYGRFNGLEMTYPHILQCWWPFEDKDSRVGYIIAITAETIAAVYCVAVQVGFDQTTVGVMIFISGQFALLKDYSTKIGGNGNECLLSAKRDARAHFRIIQCQRLHLKLVRLIKELNRMMKNIMGVYYLVATAAVCSTTIRFTAQLMMMQYAYLAQYMAAVLVQLYLYCHYGDEVYNKSTIDPGEGPYISAHWCLSPRIRRELCLLSSGVSKKHHLMAGPFNYLDLPSFVNIVRTAYSCYAFFRE